MKQVREKVLPEANDEWASDASEFDTLEELRSHLADNLSSLKKLEARLLLRERVVEALAELVADEMPVTLVAGEVERAREALAHRLAERGLTIDQYLEASGQDPGELDAEFERQAVSQVRPISPCGRSPTPRGSSSTTRILQLRSSVSPSQTNQDARSLAARLARTGGLEQLRSDVRNEKAVAWLVNSVDIVDEQGAPMDRTLLLEAVDSEEEDANRADAEVTGEDVEAADESAADSAAGKED